MYIWGRRESINIISWFMLVDGIVDNVWYDRLVGFNLDIFV